MGQLLWQPSDERIHQANITKFISFVKKDYEPKVDSYWPLYDWSIRCIPDFWRAMWDFAGIKASQKYDTIVDDLSKFPGAHWFPGARLNFAENLLKCRDDHPAFIFRGENGKSISMTYAQVYSQVASLSTSLREMGIRPGDRVCGYMPNIIETPIAMLAATALGATWASCGTELAPVAVQDRFGQIEPRIMFTADGYLYKGRAFKSLTNAEKVAEGVPSIEKVVVVPFISEKPQTGGPKFVNYHDFITPEKLDTIRFEQLPFDHPVYVMFSSGTTGKPKCMVQGAGGILLNHLKDLILHTDVKREDRITYMTSTSWMMWTWLMSSLGTEATIVLYDGNPNHPDWGTMWKLIQDERITIFGCSASYVNYLRSVGAKPGASYDLSSLREISQTGSPLSADGFQWVYHEIKSDLHFNSISGGTDINGTFAIGSPTLPVYAGELQAPALGMKINAYNEHGAPVLDQEAELVCEAPSPSMPIYFYNDTNFVRYKEAYFDFFKFAGKNVWRHGDHVIIHSDTRGITFLGRSDSVLKPSGVRIGTAEIYNVLEKMPEIADSVVVGQDWKGDERVVLFVQLSSGHSLTEDLKQVIRKNLRENASPRHVPFMILDVPGIPYTFNMKKVESAVKNIVNGKPVTNRGALSNPETLDYFEKILPQIQKDA
ncbi:MAG TPA: acetoacetate--CoA ligase [Methylomirabilota bacterium]|nr:acetoacetate--CoA ligase [Methylomirabilota bacterium]